MINYKKDTDNIVTLTLDMGSRPMNVINHEIFKAFVPVVEQLKQDKKRGLLKGVIITSGKKTFLAGGDLDYLYRAQEPAGIFEFCEKMKNFLRDIERPGVAVVAALNGSAIGAGFEVALACHHRIVVDHPKISLGLPEVEIGLIPGGGGIVRLMWLLGIERAYQILTSGHRYNPQEALRAGIVDALAKNQKDMLQQAKDWLMNMKEARRPWDRAERSIPGGDARTPKIAALIRDLAAQLAARTHQNFPAPQAILNVLSEGSKVDFETACRIESRYYTDLVLSKQCKNMIKAFWFDANYIKQGLNRPKGYGKFRPKKVGVIGAGGNMGSGIAFACLQNGLEVVMKDVSKLIAERGRDIVRNRLNALVQSGEMPSTTRDAMLKKIITTEDPREFENCDLVIETVFENAMVKQKVTKEAELYLDEYSILASNTVSIPITELAHTSARPAHYVGLHFFHPADEVPLVEVVKGAMTSDETVARAFDFVRLIQKYPIIVKDDWGFYAARAQNTYILEGITLLQEGYPPSLIENLGRQAGMPKGALALADDLGLNLVLRYETQAAAHYGPKYIKHPAADALRKMVEELNRLGRHKKAGFYEYDDKGNRQLWSGLPEHFPIQYSREYDRQELMDRLLFAQVLEAVWCMQEDVVHSIAAANLGSIFGWGFPAFKGGAIQYIHDYGVEAFLERCASLKTKYGPRFSVPKRLVEIIQDQTLVGSGVEIM
jgi:3-hydroxyacyl-CoA dehydrogenase / enoyl-CoA hydratase / 3-hydroxybutyryl-CoA epimerase